MDITNDSMDYRELAQDKILEQDYLAACAYAQVSIAFLLQRISEALENPPPNRPAWLDGPVGDELRRAGMVVPPNRFDASSFGGAPRYKQPEASPVGDIRAADPFDGVCGRCGWEFKHMSHDEKYGSHKFEPSPYKSIREWREAHKNNAD